MAGGALPHTPSKWEATLLRGLLRVSLPRYKASFFVPRRDAVWITA